MTDHRTAPHVTLDVSPRVLADVLAVTLRDRGLTVTAVPTPVTAAPPSAERDPRLAIVTDGSGGDESAAVTVILDLAGVPRALVRRGQDEQAIAIPPGLEPLLHLVDDVLADLAETREGDAEAGAT